LRSQPFSPDGRLLAGLLYEIGGKSGPTSPGGSAPGAPPPRGAEGFASQVQFFEVPSGKPAGPALRIGLPIRDVIFCPDGKTFLTLAGAAGKQKAQARLWKVPQAVLERNKPSTAPSRKDR